MPASAVHLLQDRGSVQTLDGAAHRHRKALFLSAVPQGDPMDLIEPFRDQWHRALTGWSRRPSIVLHPEMAELLTRTAAQWAGVPLPEGQVAARTDELAAMIAGAGSVGLSHWRARWLRRRCERWAAACVRAARQDGGCRTGTALQQIASHRDVHGELLPAPVAAVELLNVLRPVVAVGRFVVFAALALLRHPGWRRKFCDGDDADLLGFVQEVRRLYPFFPVIGGRALQPFRWHGHDFAVGDWMVLDLYGTDHDPRLWPDPEEFRPERFRGWKGDATTLVPQGGGEPASGHRCPGENATIALMAEAVRMLTREMRYDVPAQDLSIDLRHMPALPRDGFVIGQVRPVAS
jgi:fatty-acid peroxygenase